MKRPNCLLFLLSLSLLIFISANCRKNKNNNTIDQLPPETQTGANTFGCLVDGQPFKPGGLQLSGGSLNSIYQFVYNDDPVNGFIWGISGGKRYSNGEIKDIGFRIDSLQIIEGETYSLENPIRGGGYGQYSFYGSIGSGTNSTYQTSGVVKGSVIFKKFDLINQIASGIFWFNAVNDKGDTIKITDGRFDVRFTR